MIEDVRTFYGDPHEPADDEAKSNPSTAETAEAEGEKMPRYFEENARVLSLDESTRRVKHVISTARLDRGNRMVEPAGWRLSRFRANPTVLANHNYDIESIIGKAVDTKVEGDALVSTTEFAKEGLGNVAFRLVQEGLAKAWSVGWIGLKQHRIGEEKGCERCAAAGSVHFGTHFVQQELLEYSLVAIPANPDVVMGLQAAGLASRDECEAWAELTAKAPERSPAFLEAVFSASRNMSRRCAAMQVARRFRRVS